MSVDNRVQATGYDSRSEHDLCLLGKFPMRHTGAHPSMNCKTALRAGQFWGALGPLLTIHARERLTCIEAT